MRCQIWWRKPKSEISYGKSDLWDRLSCDKASCVPETRIAVDWGHAHTHAHHIQVHWSRRDYFKMAAVRPYLTTDPKHIHWMWGVERYRAVSEILIMNPTRCYGKRIKSVGICWRAKPHINHRDFLQTDGTGIWRYILKYFDNLNQTLNI